MFSNMGTISGIELFIYDTVSSAQLVLYFISIQTKELKTRLPFVWHELRMYKPLIVLSNANTIFINPLLLINFLINHKRLNIQETNKHRQGGGGQSIESTSARK